MEHCYVRHKDYPGVEVLVGNHCIRRFFSDKVKRGVYRGRKRHKARQKGHLCQHCGVPLLDMRGRLAKDFVCEGCFETMHPCITCGLPVTAPDAMGRCQVCSVKTCAGCGESVIGLSKEGFCSEECQPGKCRACGLPFRRRASSEVFCQPSCSEERTTRIVSATLQKLLFQIGNAGGSSPGLPVSPPPPLVAPLPPPLMRPCETERTLPL
jgi:hypothetical protein